MLDSLAVAFNSENSGRDSGTLTRPTPPTRQKKSDNRPANEPYRAHTTAEGAQVGINHDSELLC